MPYANLSAILSPAELADLDAAFTTINTIFTNKLVNLTPEERGTLYKMRNTRASFAQRAMTYAKNNPSLVPSFANYAEAEKDYKYYLQLLEIAQLGNSLAESLNDTMMAVGTEVLQFCLIFYNNFEMASRQNIPGSTSMYQDLFTFFDLPPRPEQDNETETPPPPPTPE